MSRRQLYKIQTSEWIATIGNHKKGKWTVWQRYFVTKKEAMTWIRTRKGYAQLFKATPAFIKAWPVGMKTKGKKKR